MKEIPILPSFPMDLPALENSSRRRGVIAVGFLFGAILAYGVMALAAWYAVTP